MYILYIGLFFNIANTMIVMKKQKKHKLFVLLIIFFILGTLSLQGEELLFSGVVRDSVNFKRIPDVNIFVKDSYFGTTTDKKGSFHIKLKDPADDLKIVFSHIQYQKIEFSVKDIEENKLILLSPKNIYLGDVNVSALNKSYEYTQELTNLVSEISSVNFELKGYSDAADILQSESSTMISESYNGKKTISVRGMEGSNITILYDGIRINNNFDNLFDLSIIEPSSLEQIDIIKGGNSSSFSSLGNAAVVNLIPKKEQDYFLRFKQKIGTYDSGDWNLNLYKKFGNLSCYGSYKEGGSSTSYSRIDSSVIQRNQHNHSQLVNLIYNIGEKSGNPKHTIFYNIMDSGREFSQLTFKEDFSTNHTFQVLGYRGGFAENFKTKINVISQLYKEKNSQGIADNSRNRNIEDESLGIDFRQSYEKENFNLYFNYVRDQSDLDFSNYLLNVSQNSYYPFEQNYTRKQQAFSLATEIIDASSSDYLSFEKMNLNINYEIISDKIPGLVMDVNPEKIDVNWQQTSYLASVVLKSKKILSDVNIFINYGVSNNIPTLYQQLSFRIYRNSDNKSERLLKEMKKHFEVDWDFGNNDPDEELKYRIKGAVFIDKYENKFREIFKTNSLMKYFDNRTNASIMGVENAFDCNLFRQKIFGTVAFSKFIFSDPSAFSFKPDTKITVSARYSSKLFNIETVWFAYNEQRGIIEAEDGTLQEMILPKFNNFNLHIRQTIILGKMKCYLAFSGRNLFSEERALEGIATRDRRWYFSAGFDIKKLVIM